MGQGRPKRCRQRAFSCGFSIASRTAWGRSPECPASLSIVYGLRRAGRSSTDNSQIPRSRAREGATADLKSQPHTATAGARRARAQPVTLEMTARRSLARPGMRARDRSFRPVTKLPGTVVRRHMADCPRHALAGSRSPSRSHGARKVTSHPLRACRGHRIRRAAVAGCLRLAATQSEPGPCCPEARAGDRSPNTRWSISRVLDRWLRSYQPFGRVTGLRIQRCSGPIRPA